MNGTLDAARVCRAGFAYLAIHVGHEIHGIAAGRGEEPRFFIVPWGKAPAPTWTTPGEVDGWGSQRPGVYNVTGLEPGLLKLRTSLQPRWLSTLASCTAPS